MAHFSILGKHILGDNFYVCAHGDATFAKSACWTCCQYRRALALLSTAAMDKPVDEAKGDDEPEAPTVWAIEKVDMAAMVKRLHKSIESVDIEKIWDPGTVKMIRELAIDIHAVQRWHIVHMRSCKEHPLCVSPEERVTHADRDAVGAP